MKKIIRASMALSLALAGTGTVSIAAATSASAAGYDGFCKDATGVTVVVDFQQLGGGVVVRCATSVPAGGSGLAALQQAGVPYDGVARWGDAFICRLFNKPSASQAIPVKGNTSYKEACINTPPAAAYWSYWWAPNGGSWTYSQFGVKNRSAIKGGFEGWSFSLNATAQTNPRPRIAPVRPAAAAAPAPAKPAAPAPKAAAPSNAAPKAAAPQTANPVAPQPNSTASAGTPQQPTSASSSPAPGDSSAAHSSLPPNLAAKEPSASASSNTSNPSLAAAGRAQNAKNGTLIANSNKLNQQVDKERSSSLNLPTIIGAGVLAFLAIAGVGTAIRRRSSR